MSRPLDTYPRPNVAVDLAVLTLTDQTRPALGVVVLRDEAGVAHLPGRFIRERERVGETARVVMADKLGWRPRRAPTFTMLDVYDDPARDRRGWVLSLAYATAVPAEQAAQLSGEVLVVRGSAERSTRRAMTPEHLGYDHDAMVRTAVRRMRRRYERSPDPDRLLAGPFTLSGLRHAHEAVLDSPLKRDTFNRRMTDFLEPLTHPDGSPQLTSETVGRPAQLYRHRPRPPRPTSSEPFPLPRTER